MKGLVARHSNAISTKTFPERARQSFVLLCFICFCRYPQTNSPNVFIDVGINTSLDTQPELHHHLTARYWLLPMPLGRLEFRIFKSFLIFEPSFFIVGGSIAPISKYWSTSPSCRHVFILIEQITKKPGVV